MEIMICPLQRVEREGGFKEHEVQKNGECAAGGKPADWLRGGGESDDFSVTLTAYDQRGSIIGLLDATMGAGSSVAPVRYSSTAAAQERPSEMAHTTRL